VIPLEHLVQPGLPNVMAVALAETHVKTFAAWRPEDSTGWLLAAGTVLAISLALFNHLRGAKKAGSGLGAVDHIHHAPVLSNIYDLAEAGAFDPYRWMMAAADWVGRAGDRVNKANDWLYDSLAVAGTQMASWSVRTVNTGNVAMYVVWSLAGAAALIWFLLS